MMVSIGDISGKLGWWCLVGINFYFLIINATRWLSGSLQPVFSLLRYIELAGQLGSWADKVPDCTVVDSEDRVLGLMDRWTFVCMTRNIVVWVGYSASIIYLVLLKFGVENPFKVMAGCRINLCYEKLVTTLYVPLDRLWPTNCGVKWVWNHSAPIDWCAKEVGGHPFLATWGFVAGLLLGSHGCI